MASVALCPACENDTFRVVITDDGAESIQCTKCRTVRTTLPEWMAVAGRFSNFEDGLAQVRAAMERHAVARMQASN